MSKIISIRIGQPNFIAYLQLLSEKRLHITLISRPFEQGISAVKKFSQTINSLLDLVDNPEEVNLQPAPMPCSLLP
jgi:hypothetical protein